MDKPNQQTELRILLLEDEPADAELVERTLRKTGLSFIAKRVDTREAFVQALDEFKPDIVLADYKLPSFDGGSAVKIARQQYPDIPVVIVTGAVGEETAVELLRLGAKDYILKDRLARLGDAVRRVLSEEEDARACRDAEKALLESENQLRLLLDSAAEAIYGVDMQGLCTFCNPSCIHMLGYQNAGELVGKNIHELIYCRHTNGTSFPAKDCRIYRAILRGEKVHADDEMLWRSDGTFFHAEYWSHPQIRDGMVTGAVVTFLDITSRKKSEETIWRQANFDSLTGLPNRHMFHDRLLQEIRKAHRDNMKMPLLSIDLDKFKEVNDTLGYSMGDLLLVEAAHRIKSCLNDIDTVARLDGDEFAIILPELDNVGSIEQVTGDILQKLAEPFQLGSEAVYVSASIGIALFPDDATGVEDLLKNADQAMHAAKETGRNRFNYFTQAMQEEAQTRLRLVNSLRGALADNQIMVYFQPIVELATGSINKAEALVRWRHPERGLINPAEFIPLAEETGLVFEIDDWVFRESMRWAKHWRALYNPLLQISVNKSPVQFHKGGDEAAAWLSHLQELELPGQSLAIEITERLLMDSTEAVTGALSVLRGAGVQISMDDFGTGYSSLSYLKKFDIDYLKIDRSFLSDMVTEPNDLALSEAIIVMAHKLGIKVVAEGVESVKQLSLLTLAGCDYAQGYLYSKPVPPEEFEELLKKGYL
ncbi:MAG: EAL domain-containing protein [Gallionella sp.]|nr:EAL domain-containing protein [Gallionella sp.]